METVKLTINGQEVAAPKGELLIEACEMNGVYLPRFCHHRGLTPQASCRMCVVRVDNPKIPKLQTACTTPVSDGMVVTTESTEVEETRAAMIEFLLSNHPVDCPVCDRAGECELQDQTYGFGEDRTRSQFSDKENFLERQISPFIYNDPQREADPLGGPRRARAHGGGRQSRLPLRPGALHCGFRSQRRAGLAPDDSSRRTSDPGHLGRGVELRRETARRNQSAERRRFDRRDQRGAAA